jgi:hypothetical protein
MASADLELCYLTATEAIDQFKAKKLSPVELKAVLARRGREYGLPYLR